MSKTELQKETAIHNEQQSKTKQEIIEEIIEVLLHNEGMSVYYGKEILRETMDALCRTPIICR